MNDDSSPALSIGEEISLFIRHIDSLAETLPLSMVVIQEVGKGVAKRLEQFESNHCIITGDDNDKLVRIPIEHHARWEKAAPAS